MAYDGDRTKLYGLTHNAANKKPLTRQVRMLKVGIGYSKGPSIHVYIDRDMKWVIEEGTGRNVTRKKFDTVVEAKKYYTDRRKIMQVDIDRVAQENRGKDKNQKTTSQFERLYPGKHPYFTFLRTGIDGSFWPDFEAIERHGSMPTEIEVIFLDNWPLEQSMQVWTATELKCEGNGIDARRRVDWAQGSEEAKIAAKAKAAGEKFFDIINGCYSRGCPFAAGDRPICKPHSRLNLQLAYNPMLGGTAVFDTTGWRSGGNLFSCLEQIRTITGRGNPEDGVVAGIPLKMVLRPYRTSHNGQAATQYGVSLQLRAEDAASLMRKAIGQADQFRMIVGAPKLIEAGAEETVEHLSEQAEAKSMESEFYPDAETDWEESADMDQDPEHGEEPKQQPSSGPRMKEQPTTTTEPAVDPPELVKAMEHFRKTDKQTRLDMFEEVKVDLSESLGNDGIVGFYKILQHHGVAQPGEFKTVGEAAKCYRDLWIARAGTRG